MIEWNTNWTGPNSVPVRGQVTQGRSVIVTQDHAIFLAKIAKQGHSFKICEAGSMEINEAT